jgi:hypothetical protein
MVVRQELEVDRRRRRNQNFRDPAVIKISQLEYRRKMESSSTDDFICITSAEIMYA